ncbi:hypothetical protein IEQ34_016081 [Dendrobium chrysotoxum]|uniref:Uncharacterized protein n=1 Tax=Dendrobium chrysotoxum TaxID=161865 RepID=A0AAV7GF30_DENCH|nr:hypothetical protein IEQ34_016081 [Dendrobium chrysotoxum]
MESGMAAPCRHRTARESPQLATTMCSGPTTATTAVDPTCSHLGVCSSHRQVVFRRSPAAPPQITTSASIREKLRSITPFHSIGDGGRPDSS